MRLLVNYYCCCLDKYLLSLKIKYFEDSFFTRRLLPPTFVPTQEPYNPNKNKEIAVAETEGPQTITK